MRTLKAAAAAGLALLLGGGVASAAGSAGAEPFNFLFLDANARAVAMGGAYTALATDANALLYNPAGLARVARSEATFMHNSYFADINQEYGAYASPKGWGASFNYLNSGPVANTTFSNPEGAGLGTTGLDDMAFSGGCARSLGESLSVGGEIKYIRESIAGVAGQGVAFDLGALYEVPPVSGLALGLSLQNLGPAVKYESAKQNLPQNLRGGAAYSFDADGQKCAASFDVLKERTASPAVALGLETVLAEAVPVRVGFTTNNSAGLGLTTGVGYVHDGFSFDYAFVPFGDLGVAHRLSVTFRWGKTMKPGSPRTARKEPALNEDLPAAEDDDLRRVRYNERIGRISLKENDYAGAEGSFALAIKIASAAGVKHPVVADAYAGMGRSLAAEGKAGDAATYFDKALEAGPSPKALPLIQKELEALRPKQ